MSLLYLGFRQFMNRQTAVPIERTNDLPQDDTPLRRLNNWKRHHCALSAWCNRRFRLNRHFQNRTPAESEDRVYHA